MQTDFVTERTEPAQEPIIESLIPANLQLSRNKTKSSLPLKYNFEEEDPNWLELRALTEEELPPYFDEIKG